METNSVTAKVSSLLGYVLRGLRTDLLRDLRITQSTWGHTEKKGKHLYPLHWHFDIPQVTANLQVALPRREADGPLVQVEAIVLLTHSPACWNHFFPKHCGVEKQIL